MVRKSIKVLSIVLVLALVILLYGCGATQTTTETTTAAAAAVTTAQQTAAATTQKAEPVTLTVDHFWGGTDPKAPVYKRIFDKFQQDNPNITLNIEELPADDTSKVQAMLSSGDIPSLLLNCPGILQTKFVDAGLALDLTPYLNADQAWKDSFMPTSWTSDVVFNGKVYFMPNEFYAMALMINKSDLDKVGVSVPASWDDLINVCEALQKNGITPIAACNNDGSNGIDFMASIASAMGQDAATAWTNAINGKATWNNPTIIEIMNRYVQLSKYFTKGANATSYDTVSPQFLDYSTAMLINGPWAFEQDKQSAPDGQKWYDQMVLAPFPYIDKSAKGFVTCGVATDWMVSAKLNDAGKNAAIKLLKAMTTQEATNDYLYTAIDLNCIKISNPDTSKLGRLADLIQLIDNSPVFQNAPEYWPTFKSTAVGDAMNSISQMLIDNKITPEKAVEQLDSAK